MVLLGYVSIRRNDREFCYDDGGNFMPRYRPPRALDLRGQDGVIDMANFDDLSYSKRRQSSIGARSGDRLYRRIAAQTDVGLRPAEMMV